MKVVLQNNSSSFYLAPGDQWTPRFNDARDFRTLSNLITFARKEKFNDVQVIIIMEDAKGRSGCAHLHSPTNVVIYGT